ncbi:MAG: uracil-xanthine permease [Clostridia bacterium]|nr:uracil-xanthine permease [Clostridia bacterium]MBQ6233348.1 uracil-xanthine permease [Clostridia bacterium]
MKLVYNIDQNPPIKKNLLYAFQQLLAIMAATLLVPILVDGTGTYMSQPAALCGAGFGTLFYLFIATRKKSPVFLGSSFAFISPLASAVAFGFLGIFLGALFAGLVYVVIALIIKATGSEWVNKLLPPVVIGPTVALIGLSLCGSAVNNLNNTAAGSYNLIAILVGVIAFIITVYASTKGNKGIRMIPFIIGVLGAYAIALVFTLIGRSTGNEAMQLVNLAAFDNMQLFKVPRFTFLGIFGAYPEATNKISGIADVISLFVLFAPVAFVTLAEHIADHKNLSTIIEHDLITDPGLDKTLIGDGVGSIIGSFFGGCPNTTYGESVGCVAITGNASISTIAIAAVYCIILSFFDPFVCFVNSIPSCIVGGVCIALYGFIAVSGLKMLQPVDLNDNRNLFVVAAILVPGIGGLTLNLGAVTISAIATGLILGIIINVIFNRRKA